MCYSDLQKIKPHPIDGQLGSFLSLNSIHVLSPLQYYSVTMGQRQDSSPFAWDKLPLAFLN